MLSSQTKNWTKVCDAEDEHTRPFLHHPYHLGYAVIVKHIDGVYHVMRGQVHPDQMPGLATITEVYEEQHYYDVEFAVAQIGMSFGLTIGHDELRGLK
jgi:hypothetical protein